MIYLLDTNLLLWSVFEGGRLSARAAAYLLNAEPSFACTPAGIWETGIKHLKHPTSFPARPERLLWAVQELEYRELMITARRAMEASLLPSHHRDPFDRMLVAQAASFEVGLLTADSLLVRYGSHVHLV